MQISEVLLKVCGIGLPRQSVHPGGGVAFEHEERLPEQVDAEVVEERGELLLPPLLSCLPYAGERLGTRARPCVRCVLCSTAFLLVPALGSTGSAAGCPALFVGFTATMAESDFPRSCIIGFGSSPSRCGPEQRVLCALPVGRGTSRFPYKKRLHMPGSVTTPDRPSTRKWRARAFGLPHSELCRHPE